MMRSVTRSRGGVRRGYSLIEIVIATTIVSLGLIGVAGAFSLAAKTSRLTQDAMTAQTLASDLLAEARTCRFSELDSWYTYPGETGITGLEQEFSTRLAQSRLPNPCAWFTVTNVQDDLKGVTVVITWGTGYPKGRVECETLISRRF